MYFTFDNGFHSSALKGGTEIIVFEVCLESRNEMRELPRVIS
jgi:hypothetical protein